MRLFIHIILCFCIFNPVMAIVTLPAVFSDNMIIQRDLPIKVWGRADQGESVRVTLNGHNPDDAALFNKEGLPASPFRTDNWKVSTQK